MRNSQDQGDKLLSFGVGAKEVYIPEINLENIDIFIKTEIILGEQVSVNEPDHLMVLICLAADRHRRNLELVSKETKLPMEWIERIFAKLDILGIWPVTDKSSVDLTADDYKCISDICRDELRFLLSLTSSSISRLELAAI